jgi:hypothetical protein
VLSEEGGAVERPFRLFGLFVLSVLKIVLVFPRVEAGEMVKTIITPHSDVVER